MSISVQISPVWPVLADVSRFGGDVAAVTTAPNRLASLPNSGEAIRQAPRDFRMLADHFLRLARVMGEVVELLPGCIGLEFAVEEIAVRLAGELEGTACAAAGRLLD